MASTLVIKVQFHDTLRRFNASVKENGELDLDMDALKAKILSLFDFPVDADLTLTYVDEDGDIVALVDDNDLSDVMRQSLKFLRINVLLNNGRGAKLSARSSGSSTPMRSPHVPKPSDASEVFGTPQPRDLPSFLKTVPDPIQEALHDVLLKLSVGLASKAASSSQVAGEIVDCVSKLGLSCLKNVQPSQGGSAQGDGNGTAEVTTAPMPICEEPVHRKDGFQKDPLLMPDVKSSVDNPSSGGGASGFAVSATLLKPFSLPADLNPSFLTPVSFPVDPNSVSPFSNLIESTIVNPVPSARSAPAADGKNETKKQKAACPALKPMGSVTAGCSAFPVPPPINVSPITGAAVATGPSYASPFHGPTIPFGRSFQYDSKVGCFHRGVQCDGCGAYPIVGPRFKSKMKVDYDLCSICFSEMGNETEYEKIDWPISRRAPRCFKGLHDMNKWMPPPPSPTLSPHLVGRNFWMKHAKSKLDGRFILDVNVLDGTLMAPSTSFTKIWRMRNSGTVAWPQGARLVWIGGDKFSTTDMVDLEIPADGLPVDGELDIAVDFISPQLSGRYVSYWRMALPSGIKFGQRVWVLIQVDASMQESGDLSGGLNLNLPPDDAVRDNPEVVDLNAQPSTDSLLDQSNSVNAANLVMPTVDEPRKDQNLRFPIDDALLVGYGAPASAPPEVPAASPVSYPVIDLLPEAASPVHTSDTTDAVNDVETTLLKELEEMGFRQVDLNKEVLRMNEYDLEQSVDALCGVTEWDPILEELQEMGFHDVEKNKKLLKKNNGSIKRVVMDLVTGERA